MITIDESRDYPIWVQILWETNNMMVYMALTYPHTLVYVVVQKGFSLQVIILVC